MTTEPIISIECPNVTDAKQVQTFLREILLAKAKNRSLSPNINPIVVDDDPIIPYNPTINKQRLVEKNTLSSAQRTLSRTTPSHAHTLTLAI
jgi:hypothetical protein